MYITAPYIGSIFTAEGDLFHFIDEFTFLASLKF